MNPRMNIPLTILSALAAMLCAATALATPNVQLELSAEKPEFALGEPVVIQAALHNTGTEAAEVTTVFDPTYGTVRYAIVYPDGTIKDFEPVWLDEYQKLPSATLAPGQRVTGDARLFINANDVTFSMPGRYTVNAHYGTLQAAPLTFNIIAPATAAERDTATLMTHKDVAMFIFVGGGETLTQAQPNLQKVIANAPGSLLAGYASYALGTYYTADARDFKRGTLRRADPVKAEALMSDALKQPLSTPFRLKAYTHLINAAVSNKHSDVAMKYLQEFRQRFADDPRAAATLKSFDATLPLRP